MGDLNWLLEDEPIVKLRPSKPYKPIFKEKTVKKEKLYSDLDKIEIGDRVLILEYEHSCVRDKYVGKTGRVFDIHTSSMRIDKKPYLAVAIDNPDDGFDAQLFTAEEVELI